jgi:hypothetical protein
MKDVNLVCFADDNMTISQDRLIKSFVNQSGDPRRVHVFRKQGDRWGGFARSWVNRNLETLNEKRGAGYWLWKPYIIMRVIESTPRGEWILYLDSGTEIVNDVTCLKNLGQDFVVFNNEWKHMDWCKKDVIHHMLGEKYNDREQNQIQASAIFFENNGANKDKIKSWLSHAEVKSFIDDSPSESPNISTFREHRHDQAILTNICIRHDVPLFWWATEYNLANKEKRGAKYPVLFNHHRKRNNEW